MELFSEMPILHLDGFLMLMIQMIFVFLIFMTVLVNVMELL